MPQPITNLVRKPHVTLDEDVLQTMPDLALIVCKIFATWSLVEQTLSALLISVLGANSTPALAIFGILNAQHLQHTALDAAARAALPPDDYRIFKAAIAVANSAQAPRNQLAHWAWARCEQRKDLLLLANPKMLSARDLRAAKLLHSAGDKTDPLEYAMLNLFDDSEILAYSKEDLERALRDLLEAKTVINMMSVYLDPSYTVHIAPYLGHKKMSSEFIRQAALTRMNGLRTFREAFERIQAKG